MRRAKDMQHADDDCVHAAGHGTRRAAALHTSVRVLPATQLTDLQEAHRGAARLVGDREEVFAEARLTVVAWTIAQVQHHAGPFT
jgi:hypothetical protein